MAAFKFEAINAGGKVKEGVVDADSIRLARGRLRDMGLMPVKVESLESIHAKAPGKFGFFRRSRFTSLEQSQITRQLSTLINAGLNIEQSLAATAEQTEKQSLKELLLGVRASVMAGNSLSSAMSQYSEIFPDVYCAIVQAGEQSGEIAQVLDRLASYTESRQMLKQKVIAAFIYPALITLTAVLVIGGLLIYVVPQVVSVFEQSKQHLPLLTVSMIFISDILSATWIYMFALFALMLYFFSRSMQNIIFRNKVHQHVLKLPILGSLVISLNTAKFARTLSILVGSGVPIIASLSAAAKSTALLPMREAISTANLYSAVQPGGSLYGLQHSNPVNTLVAYRGDVSKFGTGTTDPMVGLRIGGINVFGGGVALYNASGQKIGAVGVSGDTSCADHYVAWEIRKALLGTGGVSTPIGGVGLDNTDNIIYDITPDPGVSNGVSLGGWGHAGCAKGNPTPDAPAPI